VSIISKLSGMPQAKRFTRGIPVFESSTAPHAKSTDLLGPATASYVITASKAAITIVPGSTTALVAEIIPLSLRSYSSLLVFRPFL
jgi:hypothetical protein